MADSTIKIEFGSSGSRSAGAPAAQSGGSRGASTDTPYTQGYAQDAARQASAMKEALAALEGNRKAQLEEAQRQLRQTRQETSGFTALDQARRRIGSEAQGKEDRAAYNALKSPQEQAQETFDRNKEGEPYRQELQRLQQSRFLGVRAAGGALGLAAGVGVPGAQGIQNIGAGMAQGGIEGAAGAAAKELVGTIQRAYSTINNFQRTTAQYDPATAAAQGMANAQTVMGDIRRADRLGPEMADFTTARGNAQNKTMDVIAELLKPFIPLATSLLEWVADNIAYYGEKFANGFNMLIEGTNKMLQGLEDLVDKTTPWTIHLGRLDKIAFDVNALRRIGEDKPNQPTSVFIDELFKMDFGFVGGNLPQNRQQPLGIPILANPVFNVG